MGIISLDKFPSLTFDDILNYKPKPEDIIAGKGWLKRGGCTLLSGSTGIGKTVLAEQLALCCASGKSFLGINIPEAVKVVCVQAESDPDYLKRDFAAIQKHYRMNMDLLKCNLTTRRVFWGHS